MRRAGSSPGPKVEPSLAWRRALPQHIPVMGADSKRRTYLVVVDDSAEARTALRFAARRAAKTQGRVEILGLVEPQDFVQWGGVQSAIEEEQRLRIAGVVSAAVGEYLDETGIETSIVIQQGEPARTLREYLGSREDVSALVLGAAPSGSPGPLVASFCGTDAGKLPCPVMVIPGSLTDDRLDQLS
jgi:nucleotide-binding universal stress UspA family protein